ncbi:MAG: L,D-transpeptidase family protein [Bacteroidota bacterium]
MRTIITSFFLFISTISTSSVEAENTLELTKNIIERFFSEGKVVTRLDTLSIHFYSDRNYRPVWNRQMALDFLEILKNSKNEGFVPEDYASREIQKLLSEEAGDVISPSLELLLTRNFLEYIKHLSQGILDPEEIYSLWAIEQAPTDYWQVLCDLSKAPNLHNYMTTFQPKTFNYKILRSYSVKYHRILREGGWPQIDSGVVMKPGVQDDRLTQLRNRLWMTGDLAELDAQNQLFDCQLEDAVRNFQYRHGLEINGSIDDETLNVLNIPVKEKLAIIQANMERLRWFDADHPSRYFMVNIPAYQMKIIADEKVTLQMKVAVGKRYRQTPVFQAEMDHVVLNPYWVIPPSILYYDVLPSIKKDIGYLDRLKIDVLSMEGDQIHPDSVDWSTAEKGNFPYMLRQDPGAGNALGKVKFMFPNKFNIYMHDTNHPEVFDKRDLARSSGCVRLSEPMVLARHLLKDQLPKKVRGKHQTYLLKEKIPVYITYQTAFVDEQGRMHFRDDIYNKDKKLVEAMSAKCHASSALFL